MKIKSMKAAILVKQNQPLVVDQIRLPQSLEYGQVLVKVFFSGICGSQIGEINGVKGEDPYIPHLLGHEGSGEVVETGQGVKSVNNGDKVVMHWKVGEGIDSSVPNYTWKGEKLNAGQITTFNEYAIVSENRITKINDNLPLDIAPLFGCAVTTGFGAIENNANLKMGESIIVLGAGGVGLNIIQAASLYNAHPIVAVDLHDEKLILAKKLGATHTINSSTENWFEKGLQLTLNQGFDVAIDNTGNTEIISQCYEIANDSGRTILVGVPKKGKKASFYTLPLHFNKTILGSHGGNGNPSKDILRYQRLYELGKINFDNLVTRIFTLDEINLAIEEIINGNISGRCLIRLQD